MNFGKYIAHRGLHDKNAPENSLLSFENAVKRDVPAELDVRLTKDCRIVVFHDSNLLRMCGIDANLSDFTYEQLQTFKLANSDEGIPLLSDVLKIVDGKISLLIEIKDGSPFWELEKRLHYLLKNYKGEYAIQSFNPFSLLWYRLFSHKTFRGQIISKYKDIENSKYYARLVCASPWIWRLISKPNFIASDLRSISLETAFQAVDINADLYTWTANTSELIETALSFSKTVIAENFTEDFDFIDKEGDSDET